MTMRHGLQNERADDYSTVAFWYQTEAHKAFPELPQAEERYPSRPDPASQAAQTAPGTGVPQSSIEK